MDIESLNVLIFTLHEDHDAARCCLASLEPERFRDFACEQQVAGYLYALHQAVKENSPLQPEVASLLKVRYLQQWTHTERLMRELRIIQKRFQQAGEDFILLKGPYLASRFYGDSDRREIRDLDLLVRRESFTKSWRLVEDCGFRANSRAFFSPGLVGPFIHDKEFQKGDIPLELHHVLRAYPGFNIAEETLWKHRTRIDLVGGSYSALADAHSLLNQVLSVHHDIALGTITLRSFVDLFMILKRVSPELNWKEFFDERKHEGTLLITVNVLALVLAALRCERRFPEVTERVMALGDCLVRPMDTATVLGLISTWPLHARKNWAFRQYPGSLSRAVLWWMAGMPFAFAAHRNIFFTNWKDRVRGKGGSYSGGPAMSAAVPDLPAMGVSPHQLQQGMLRFGSLKTRVRFNSDRYIKMLGDLFRINLQISAAANGDCDLEIDLIEVEASQVPQSNGWFIRHTLDGPVQHVIVRREFDGITSIYHDVVAAHIHENNEPPRVIVPIWATGQSSEHLLHCLMVIFYKLLFYFGRAHLHAAAVKTGRSVSMFYGDKGVGKTTICLFLGRHEGTVLAEDHIVLRRMNDRFCVSGCDGIMRVTEKTERYFFADPLPAPQVLIAGTPKKELDMNDHISCRQCEDMPVDRLFFPHIGGKFSISPIAAPDASQRLQQGIEERYRFASADDRAAFVAFLHDFTSTVASYELELSPDLDQLTQLVTFLEQSSNRQDMAHSPTTI